MLLSDMLVIDLTDRLGWLAGRVLADLGADVIKIETPGSDPSRADWRAFNVNKRVLELDLQASADRARLEDLLRAADICLLTSSVSSTYLDPHALRENYPRLVVVAIRPFGGVGPRNTWKASDIELMAAGGAMALAGEPDGMPVRVSEPQSYGWAGAQGAIGALVALAHRDATGRGDLVDVSAQASVVTALSHAPAFVDLLGLEPTRAGAFMTGRSIKGARYRVFWPCRDGYINFIFYGGVAGRRTNEQLVAWMRECRARRARRHRLEGLGPHQGRPERGRRHRGAGGEILRSAEQARIPDRRAPARNAGLSGVDGRRYRQRSPARGARLLPGRRRRCRALLRQLRSH
jgi:crotonobetainyl-CoA:carnitine CoA-transferase CaiB-like acyl-CoA transferase